jgi:hypothetical protein
MLQRHGCKIVFAIFLTIYYCVVAPLTFLQGEVSVPMLENRQQLLVAYLWFFFLIHVGGAKIDTSTKYATLVT